MQTTLGLGAANVYKIFLHPLFLWYFPNDDSSLLHLLINIAEQKNYLFSSLYIFIPLFIYISLDSWGFILELKSCLVAVVLVLTVFQLGHWVDWCVLLPRLLDFLSIPSPSRTTWCFWLILYLWWPSCEMNLFSEEPCFLSFWNTVLRDSIWVLAVLTITGAPSLCSPLGQSWVLRACVLIHMCACVHAQLCLTLCNPMDCDPAGSSLHGILQARTLEWVAVSFSKGSSQPRDQTCVSLSLALAGGFFTTSGTWERKSEVTQTCPTLCDSVDCSPPGFSIHGVFQARMLEWVAISFSRGSSLPRDRTQVSCIEGRCFTLRATWEACTNLHLHTYLHR